MRYFYVKALSIKLLVLIKVVNLERIDMSFFLSDFMWTHKKLRCFNLAFITL